MLPEQAVLITGILSASSIIILYLGSLLEPVIKVPRLKVYHG